MYIIFLGIELGHTTEFWVDGIGFMSAQINNKFYYKTNQKEE